MNSGERHRILVVEDHSPTRGLLERILREVGYAVDSAADGADGLKRAREVHPDLVITDLVMPRLDGHTFVRQLREMPDFKAVPVIVLTGRNDNSAMRTAMRRGADDYIYKPFETDDLLQSVAVRLERKDLVDELSAFAHTVAHDLRSPISVLLGRLELAEGLLDDTCPPRLRAHLEGAQEASNRLNTIIDEILMLTSLRQETVEPEPLDMGEIVQEAIARTETTLHRNDATVNVADDWPVALGYAPWVVHLWSNFISNAAKYGGESPHIDLLAETHPDKRCVRFIVRDHGAGIEPAMLTKMFTAFSKIPQHRHKGHGLGLSIVRRIVSQLHGRCGVDSPPGEGASFWFELPAASA
ncbi:hybrid sensor histidine kinase/response regulator [Actomonas aquatica]|uniref:histidine kinase n=1 Tax=Actomonas aquatica TaxID=2866162 RepID=A0ABZ1C4K6_9BACT|nr:response regulator [Opitutus sp. WL0086]WRQ86421.1 response regulator [Opitutus sp. WL0086]